MTGLGFFIRVCFLFDGSFVYYSFGGGASRIRVRPFALYFTIFYRLGYTPHRDHPTAPAPDLPVMYD